jgi:hypothetical protein
MLLSFYVACILLVILGVMRLSHKSIVCNNLLLSCLVVLSWSDVGEKNVNDIIAINSGLYVVD